jgi:hypothetical protein
MLSFTKDDREALHQAGITAELHSPQPQLMSLDEVLQNKFALRTTIHKWGFTSFAFPMSLSLCNYKGSTSSVLENAVTVILY